MWTETYTFEKILSTDKPRLPTPSLRQWVKNRGIQINSRPRPKGCYAHHHQPLVLSSVRAECPGIRRAEGCKGRALRAMPARLIGTAAPFCGRKAGSSLAEPIPPGLMSITPFRPGPRKSDPQDWGWASPCEPSLTNLTKGRPSRKKPGLHSELPVYS